MTIERPGLDDLRALINHGLRDPTRGWSIGVHGAIAEFHRRPGDRGVVDTTVDGGSVITALGGIRVALQPGIGVVAQGGMTFCLAAAAAIGGSDRLRELGPDAAALRARDRRSVLFDIGVGADHVIFAVRVADAGLIETLRRAEGAPYADGLEGSGHMAAIMAANPARVVQSALGRIEVNQPIAAPGGASPEGPHTHFLPALLRGGRDPSPARPIPPGWLPCLDLHGGGGSA